MAGKSFAHLHVHTEYSMLDGAAKLGPLFAEVKRLGMPAVAMTDHGNMFASLAFYKAARDADVKPIIGIEAYVAPLDRFTRKPVFWGNPGQRNDDVSANGAYTHMTLLARNAEGLRNLFRLSSLASIEGTYHKPRMDRELLSQYSAGIIATTGCASGAVQTHLRLGQRAEALQEASDLRDIFGADSFYLEVMDHGIEFERRTRQDLLEVGKRLGLPALATNDSHYVTRDQAAAHGALLCIQSGSKLDDPDRFKFDGDGYYIKPAAEMRRLWDSEIPDACDNTLLVASSVEDYGEVFAPQNLMPKFTVPDGETDESWLRKETWAGMAHRFPDGYSDEYRARAEYELDVIVGKGFASYFLVVADIVAHARSLRISVGPGRGSATGCMVAYALGITQLDPIEHKLIFERLLNPERVSMPDIDLDIDDRRRDDMIRYVTEKYGSDRVCQIITFNTIGAKAAIKDAARVLGYPYSLGDRMTKAFPVMQMGKEIPLAAITDKSVKRYAEASAVRDIVNSEPEAKRTYELARGLEGIIRQAGVHAAGVIICSEPLLGILPLVAREDGTILAGYTFTECEEIGLLKMDFLGLRNLSVIDEAVALVRANHDPGFSLSPKRLEDERTYELMASGDTLGVFQLDGGPMRHLLQAMAPTRFEDVAAVIALYRPGPMAANAHNDYADRKNGRQRITPIHPELAEPLADILDETYGLIVYQEQVLAIAQRVAGYTLGSADMLRRAMGKKKADVLAREFEAFHAGMQANGYSAHAIKTLWDILVPFAGYAFNKCISGETLITRIGRGNHDWPQTARNLANRIHGREDYDGTGCKFCDTTDVGSRAIQCGPCKSWRSKWRLNGGMNAAGRVGDRILPVKIVDVFRQGVKPLWRMTLDNGMSVTTTANHRHLTPDGWRRLDELSVGDAVSTMCAGEWNIAGPRTDAPCESRNWIGERGYYAAERSDGRPGTFLHGRSAEFKRNTATLDRVCAECGSTDGRLERAHLDGNPLNNAASNLAYLCNSCHKRNDYANGGRTKMWRKGRPIGSSAIVSIEYVGEEMTYDVTVDSDDHSWVANGGIVTHNSHTAGYGILSFWTAYLKANYPAEYMAALLTSVGDNATKMGVYLRECRHRRITVLQPDVNASAAGFTAEGDVVRFGLAAIRNVGRNVVEAIVRARREAPFTDFYDFVHRVDPVACNKKVIESMIKAGAFDSLGHTRRGLIAIHADAIDSYASIKKNEAVGQFDIMSMLCDEDDEDTSLTDDPPIPTYEWDQRTLLALEREVLGMYVSDHPLLGKERMLEAAADQSLDALVDGGGIGDGATVKFAGVLSNVEHKISKSGSPWASATLEDLTGSAQLLVFSKNLDQVRPYLVEDAVVYAKCRVDRSDEQPRLMVLDMGHPSEVAPEDDVLTIALAASATDDDLVERMKAVLLAHAGPTEVNIHLTANGRTTPLRIVPRVKRSPALIRELRSVLGQKAVS